MGRRKEQKVKSRSEQLLVETLVLEKYGAGQKKKGLRTIESNLRERKKIIQTKFQI